ncbi:hypothetical protein ACN47E_000635 [Coniothyrium glycines]
MPLDVVYADLSFPVAVGEYIRHTECLADDVKLSESCVPVTHQRKPFINRGEGKHLDHAGTARYNAAASAQAPEGTLKDDWVQRHAHQTVLQQHCDFFDRDHDGVLWPSDTFIGFRRLDFNVFLCALAVLLIHGNFSYPTCPSVWPDPYFRIYLANIHRCKHGSDTGTYDHEGRFVPQHFEDVFAKYSTGRQFVTMEDVGALWKGQRCFGDLVGWSAEFLEWFATYLLLWPEDGRMMKEDVRRIYDGSIFYEIAAKREKQHRLAGMETGGK